MRIIPQGVGEISVKEQPGWVSGVEKSSRFNPPAQQAHWAQ